MTVSGRTRSASLVGRHSPTLTLKTYIFCGIFSRASENNVCRRQISLSRGLYLRSGSRVSILCPSAKNTSRSATHPTSAHGSPVWRQRIPYLFNSSIGKVDRPPRSVIFTTDFDNIAIAASGSNVSESLNPSLWNNPIGIGAFENHGNHHHDEIPTPVDKGTCARRHGRRGRPARSLPSLPRRCDQARPAL